MKKICSIGGEGIGVEVIASARKVLDELSLPDTEIIDADAGVPAIEKTGAAFPAETKDAIDDSNAILFGATENKARPVLGYLRFQLDNYANIRPCKLYKGISSPLKHANGIDFVIIRENLESIYSVLRVGEGNLSALVRKRVLLNPKVHEEVFKGSKGKFALKIITEVHSERIAKLACDMTVKRKKEGFPGKLTIVHKANVLHKTDGLFRQISYDIAKHYIDKYNIKLDDYFVDDMARRLVCFPDDTDIMLAINEYGDILSDLGAELVGGLGLAPSGCIGSDHPYFEPVHGSAPDIAGQGIANPLGAILSLHMLLEHLGYKEADILEDALKRYFLTLEDPKNNWKSIPRDLVPEVYREQNKFANTTAVTEEIIRQISLN